MMFREQPDMTWFIPIAILFAIGIFSIDVMFIVAIYQIKKKEKENRLT